MRKSHVPFRASVLNDFFESPDSHFSVDPTFILIGQKLAKFFSNTGIISDIIYENEFESTNEIFDRIYEFHYRTLQLSKNNYQFEIFNDHEKRIKLKDLCPYLYYLFILAIIQKKISF